MYNIEYLLKYVSNDCYKKILNSGNDYLLDSLVHYRVNVDLNIRYLIDIGISNLDSVIYDRLEDLIKPHSDFMKMIDNYIDKMGKDNFISMIENMWGEIMKDVENLLGEVKSIFDNVKTLEELNDLRVEYMGKKGKITEVNSHIKDVDNDKKKE